LRETLDRLGERQVLELPQERDRVAPLAASVAIEELLGRRDAERGCLLLVERAEAGHVVAPGLLEREVLRDELDDVGPFADRLHVFLPDPAGHRGSLER